MILGFLEWPLGVRLAMMAVVGALLAAVVNWAVYTLAFEPRFPSPWSRKPKPDFPFAPSDRLPLYGWWRLRRFAPKLGRGYWLQPLVVEIICAIGTPYWYWWETVRGELWSPPFPANVIAAQSALGVVLHMQFFVHIALAAFMLAASLIDADEHTIPDAITVPGTLFGLTLLTFLPLGLMPHYYDPQTLEFFWLHASEPGGLPNGFNPTSLSGLAVGLACFGFWCWGLIFGGRMRLLSWGPSRFRRSLRVFVARVRFDPQVPWILGIGIVGSLLITMVWYFDPPRWATLFTALVGLFGGAAVIWIVRVLGTWAFQKEAMGFGDVTLMAMMGAYLGWQPTMIIFFAAPIAALVLCLPSWLMKSREMLPYGPYLCAAALGVILAWGPIWRWAAPQFVFAWLVPAVLVVGFVILGIALSILRIVRSLAGR